MDEFGFIASMLAPLAAREKGALGLKDDAAVLRIDAGYELVITKDALSSGVHFIGSEPASLLARKLLAVNLSDIAAMGAQPWGYFLALMLPAGLDAAWRENFARGLQEAQQAYGVTLMGGDTTGTQGTLSLCATMLGRVKAGTALLRSGAKAGDDIYVTGTLADGALGLKVAQGEMAHDDFLLERYHLPRPRLALGQGLYGIATACMDISDGVVQDMEHMAAASGVGAELFYSHVPLSPAGARALAGMQNAPEIVLAGGDDYELLFTVPPGKASLLAACAAAAETNVTRIGRVIQGSGVTALDTDGHGITLTQKGFRHF